MPFADRGNQWSSKEPRLRPLEGGAALSDEEVRVWIWCTCIPGKSLIYGLLLTVFDCLQGYGEPTSVDLIVSQLASLMIDEKAGFLSRGISAESLGEAQHDAHALQRMRESQHQLVFLTSESLFHGQSIQKTLMAESVQSKLMAFVVNETHCIKNDKSCMHVLIKGSKWLHACILNGLIHSYVL